MIPERAVARAYASDLRTANAARGGSRSLPERDQDREWTRGNGFPPRRAMHRPMVIRGGHSLCQFSIALPNVFFVDVRHSIRGFRGSCDLEPRGAVTRRGFRTGKVDRIGSACRLEATLGVPKPQLGTVGLFARPKLHVPVAGLQIDGDVKMALCVRSVEMAVRDVVNPQHPYGQSTLATERCSHRSTIPQCHLPVRVKRKGFDVHQRESRPPVARRQFGDFDQRRIQFRRRRHPCRSPAGWRPDRPTIAR